ncbi:MAG: hypothetical protein ACOZNI_09390 [Myxococcota bacterium]
MIWLVACAGFEGAGDAPKGTTDLPDDTLADTVVAGCVATHTVDYRSALSGERYTYDTAGRVVLWELDDEGDGVWEDAVAYTLDAEGRVVVEETSYLGGLVAVATTTWTGDDAHVEYDDPADGTIDAVREVVAEAGVTTTTHDDGPDGVTEWRTVAEVDGWGNPAFYGRDEGDDGAYEELVSYASTYDGELRTRLETDAWDDGDVDRIEDWQWHASGAEAWYGLDYDADGDVNYAVTTERAADGAPVWQLEDDDGDGADDTRVDFETNAAAQVTRAETDWDIDAEVDVVEAWTYDGEGRQTLYTYERAGSVEVRWETEWACP